MKFSTLLGLLALSAWAVPTLGQMAPVPSTGTPINTRGNNVGIDASDVCRFENLGGEYAISCDSGLTFGALDTKSMYATGTPVWLNYPTLIGTWANQKRATVTTEMGPSRIGGNKLTVFCHGGCMPLVKTPIWNTGNFTGPE